MIHLITGSFRAEVGVLEKGHSKDQGWETDLFEKAWYSPSFSSLMHFGHMTTSTQWQAAHGLVCARILYSAMFT